MILLQNIYKKTIKLIYYHFKVVNMRLRPAYANAYGENPSAIDAYPQQEQPRRGRDYLSEAYDWGRELFVKRPYKGFSLFGGALGFLAGGPVGALVGAGVFGGGATAYHWLWGREGEDPNFPPYLNGMSIGKRIRQYWSTGK